VLPVTHQRRTEGKTMFSYLKIDLQQLLDEGISREAAIDLMVNKVESEKSKRKQTIEEAVNIAASYTVSQAFSQHRRTICHRADKICRDRGKGAAVLKEKIAGLMGFRLPCGTALADATGTDCAEAADFYSANAKVHQHRANFLRQIADRAGKKCVSKVLKESDLQQAYDNAGSMQ
jgi:hypothetical protein